jgi:hypothetical protein
MLYFINGNMGDMNLYLTLPHLYWIFRTYNESAVNLPAEE